MTTKKKDDVAMTPKTEAMEKGCVPAGAYICKILDATYHPEMCNRSMPERGEYTTLKLDIAEGDYAGFFFDYFNEHAECRLTHYVCNKVDNEVRAAFDSAIRASNPDIQLDWAGDREQLAEQLVGLKIGVVISNDYYIDDSGKSHDRNRVKCFVSTQMVRSGKCYTPTRTEVPFEEIVRNVTKARLILAWDTRQKEGKHDLTLNEFFRMGIAIKSVTMPDGDVAILDSSSVVIDTKAGIDEFYNNVVLNHENFRWRVQRARTNHRQLIYLIATDEDIHCVDDLKSWHSRWTDSQAGMRMYKILQTMIPRYGFEVMFCKPEDEPREIARTLLTREAQAQADRIREFGDIYDKLFN